MTENVDVFEQHRNQTVPVLLAKSHQEFGITIRLETGLNSIYSRSSMFEFYG